MTWKVTEDRIASADDDELVGCPAIGALSCEKSVIEAALADARGGTVASSVADVMRRNERAVGGVVIAATPPMCAEISP